MRRKLIDILCHLYELLEYTEELKDNTDCLEATQLFYKHMDTIEYLKTAITTLEKIK